MNFVPLKQLVASLSAFVLVFTTCFFGITSFPASSQADPDLLCGPISETKIVSLKPGQVVPFDRFIDPNIDVLESWFGNSSVQLALYKLGPNGAYYYNCKYFNYDLQLYSLQVDFKHSTLQVIPNSLADVEIPASQRTPTARVETTVLKDPYCQSWGVSYLAPGGIYAQNSCFYPDEKVVTIQYGKYFAVSDSPISPISISSTVPQDIPGEAANADLTQAAIFAWEEFIALNWPNKSLNSGSFHRETPDTSAKFGKSFSSTLNQPLVWETLPNKVEIFPGFGNMTINGITYSNSPWADRILAGASPPNFNDLGAPQYYDVYNKQNGSYITSCNDSYFSSDAWVNLDESNEIGEANMFAGVVPPEGLNSSGAYTNQQFAYLAKAGRNEYNYVKNRGWNLGNAIKNSDFGTARTNTQNYMMQYQEYPQPNENSGEYISLPYNTIEIKSGWRRLSDDEANNSFHTAPIRYYTTDENDNVCFEQEPAGEWGMAALHIIQKTPSAPYFIFATFSQADNIVDGNGNPVEDENGRYIGPSITPTTPEIQADTSGQPPAGEVSESYASGTGYVSGTADLSQWQSFRYDQNSLPQEHEPTDKRIYYTNIPNPSYSGDSPPSKPIAVNKRQNLIPDEVIAVNQAAHDAIRAYNEANGISDSPWLHYKLVNVQWKPLTKDAPGPIYTKDDAATYYLANEILETDFSLQFFSGQFEPSVPKPQDPQCQTSDKYKNFLLITDYPADDDNPCAKTANKFHDSIGQYANVFHTGEAFNMGGCMGCHGVAANGGGDFSFILKAAGGLQKPEEIGSYKSNSIRLLQILEGVNAIAGQ